MSDFEIEVVWASYLQAIVIKISLSHLLLLLYDPVHSNGSACSEPGLGATGNLAAHNSACQGTNNPFYTQILQSHQQCCGMEGVVVANFKIQRFPLQHLPWPSNVWRDLSSLEGKHHCPVQCVQVILSISMSPPPFNSSIIILISSKDFAFRKNPDRLAISFPFYPCLVWWPQ